MKMESNTANMKKNPACSRSKPPPVRSSFLGGKLRTHLTVDRPGFHSPSGIDNSNRLLSMSENPETTETVDNICALKASSKEVTDCMSDWLTFIQMLKGLCSAGAQLSQCLGTLGGQSPSCQARAVQCQAMWEHLGSATTAAADVVKNQTVTALQEAHIGPDIDSDQADTNQQVVCNGLVTLVNLQYQFSLACCDCLARLVECQCVPQHVEPDTHAVARCYTRMPPPPPPQRRWSEVGSRAEGRVGEGTRRWSMPWKLSLPTTANERSRSITPDAIWHTALASQEELQEVIALLSMKPGPQGHHLPGVTLTRAVEPMTSRFSSHRGSWSGDGEEPEVTGMLVSRKSSSSTDCSSSCYSLHSRTSTSGSEELTHGQKSHLYSMWSGSDLPFIKLPESSKKPET
uniref:DUF4745 domain-containing protein n=1 Tax=Graphocephala atropunctata TaxID=36148 RepID=A0A1B6ML39_9HEMI